MCAYVCLGVYGCAHVRTYVAGHGCAWLGLTVHGFAWPGRVGLCIAGHCCAWLGQGCAGQWLRVSRAGARRTYVRSLRAQDFLIIVVRVPFGRDVNGGILAIPTRKRLFATHEKARDKP